jgi:hypothetical protein
VSGHPNVTGSDDLTRIEGIGSKRAERLHAAGIRTYVDLASRSADDITMTMTIYLADPASHADRLAYSALIVARPMAGGLKQTVAQTSGLFPTTSPTIRIDAAGLPAGAYRLDGAVSLREPGGDHSAYLAAMTEGLLVQVLPD